MRTINIIGCGKVGKTLGRLWVLQGLARIGDVLNRSPESSQAAVAFLGAGRAVKGFEDLAPADIQLISTTDTHIAAAAENLACCGVIRSGDVVFHCSGSLSSAVLAPLRSSGAVLGSVHPVKSFADPERSVASFAGTFCAMEADGKARVVLTELFTGIGAKVFPVRSENKMIYHAATVLVCNYLTSLVELACRCLLKAGLDGETALRMMEPLALETVGNIFHDGTVRALTGPISRGEKEIVAGQLEALSRWQPEMGEVYRLLGKVALDLAVKKGAAPRESLAELEQLLAAERRHR
ncbi:MAG: DUF2520 domain-containing protein [Deltaproteobacteria bacterium]|nr:DUF2520 domain-containing protein [Deltaproteobacteria bacterium]